MFSFRSQGRNHVSSSLETGVQPEAKVGHHQGWWRQRGALTRVVAAGLGTGAVVAALAVPAAASGAPNIWDGAQVGLNYPVYQPMTVLGLPLSSFKLLSCGTGQDESVSATYGKAYTPISNLGKVAGFSIAEGYPNICNNPGTARRSGSGASASPRGRLRFACRCIAAQQC